MLTRRQCQFYEKYQHEPSVIAGAVLKVMVLLTFLALVSWIMADEETTTNGREADSESRAAYAATQVQNATARDRKELFDKRRIRFNDGPAKDATASPTVIR